MFYFKSMETDARRVNNWEAQGASFSKLQLPCRCAMGRRSKGGAFVVSCLFRRASRVDTIIGDANYISWVKHSILSFSLVNE